MNAAINAGSGGSVDLPSTDGAARNSTVRNDGKNSAVRISAFKNSAIKISGVKNSAIKISGVKNSAVKNSAARSHGRRRAEPAPRPKGHFASKVVTATGRAVLTIILILAALVFLFLAVGPRFLNYQTSTMLTGSMSPGINPGDVVVSVRTPVSELKVGDVITYSIPIDDHRIETHRVASIHSNDAGQTSVITKGDANPGSDPWTAVLSEDYVYTQAAVVPYLGDVIRALRQPLAQAVLLYGACGLLVAVVLTSIWRKPATAAEAPGISDTDGSDSADGAQSIDGADGTQGAEPTSSKL